MEDQVSIFKPVSIGYVTAPKDFNSRNVQVLLAEVATGTDGEATFNPQDSIVKAFDNEGNTLDIKITETVDMECEWLPNEDNRATAPDVQRGEVVMVFRLGDTTQYFWQCLGIKNGLRQLEHVVITYGAIADAKGSGMDFSKCYYQQWSPRDGNIVFGTSKANGEAFAYKFMINTKDSVAGLTDDGGNYFELSSKDTRLKLINASNSFIQIEKTKATISADQGIDLICGGSTLKMTPASISTNTSTTTIKSGGSMTIDAPAVTARVGKWDFV